MSSTSKTQRSMGWHDHWVGHTKNSICQHHRAPHGYVVMAAIVYLLLGIPLRELPPCFSLGRISIYTFHQLTSFNFGIWSQFMGTHVCLFVLQGLRFTARFDLQPSLVPIKSLWQLKFVPVGHFPQVTLYHTLLATQPGWNPCLSQSGCP